jgi:hypothetical protein
MLFYNKNKKVSKNVKDFRGDTYTKKHKLIKIWKYRCLYIKQNSTSITRNWFRKHMADSWGRELSISKF